MIFKDYVVQFYKKNTGAINGASVGLILATLILVIGLFKTLFIAICVAIGYYVGKRLSNDKDCIRKFLDKILPPGTYR